MVSLAWRHCGQSLSNYDSKFLSDPFIIDYDVDYVQISMFSLSYGSLETRFFMIENRQMLVLQRQYIIIFILYHQHHYFFLPIFGATCQVIQ